MSTTGTQGEWISGCEAGRRLRVNHKTMARFAERWGIRRRVLQGAWTTYLAADVDAVAARAVILGEGVAPEPTVRDTPAAVKLRAGA